MTLVGGALGTICLGLFASKAVNAAGADGFFAGNRAFLGKQSAAVLLGSVWAFVFTYVMLMAIHKITPVKVSEDVGLDTELHSEQAYDDLAQADGSRAS